MLLAGTTDELERPVIDLIQQGTQDDSEEGYFASLASIRIVSWLPSLIYDLLPSGRRSTALSEFLVGALAGGAGIKLR